MTWSKEKRDIYIFVERKSGIKKILEENRGKESFLERFIILRRNEEISTSFPI